MTAAIPLRALVARAERVADIVAPQYDSIPRGGRYRYALERPDSFVNVTLSAADFPEPVPHRSTIAQRAADHFERMLDRGLFETLPAPAFFLYELDTGRHRQLGIVAGIPVSAITGGRVIGHEGTIEERVEDLAAFFRMARLASSPVALGFRADEGQRSLMERLASRSPIRDFEGMDGVRQRLWMISDPAGIAEIEEATARIGTMYVTDGHHRIAASCRAGAVPGWFLAILFPTDHLRALEYNRSVRLGEAPGAGDVRQALPRDWEMTEIGPAGGTDARPRTKGEVSMLLGGVWYRLSFRGARSDDPVESLDVSLLHDMILGPVLSVSSYEDPRLSYEVGDGAVTRLERRVQAYPDAVGFAMYPAPIGEMMAVADAGRLMPPKSTWFTPKPCSGLLVVRWEQSDLSAALPGDGGSAPVGGSGR